MQLIKGTSTPEVWLAACEYLRPLPEHEDFDVFLHITDPSPLSKADAKVLGGVDDFLVGHGGVSVNTVAETIFPLQDYLRGGKDAVFETYPERMARIHAVRTDRQWGNYAMRILRQKDRDGTIYNPLKDLLKKIQGHGQYKATFELGLGNAMEVYEAFGDDIAIYDGAADRRPLYGHLPCLMHLSIKLDHGKVRLNATYRAHYYVQRLLGNLVGLARLQYFLAHEAGQEIGPLTINSTYAKLDTGAGGRWNLGDIDALLATSRQIYTIKEAA
ncbi:hypothetical protein FJ434_22850 [Mesorhizobium sp. B2-5-13]|uniref:hypothetical protein n=1 Tax=unclassified Mesorhizobium TaxID=325217 RepID=UPI00112CC98E|nr:MULTISPECIES: hypothetical protein [unclassified Mesorhizobium]TPJ38870.1 hypothetical protein FJ432_21225 [Mesorhizobium sp. B2-6-5]TPJ79451.1 hypothetical protein FJ434_22850 [Mesorhizobium sp. B2-5-13]TPK46269.1 hypothetical protein FJ560_19315 [Mesorhizobium sp. B2-5-5]